MIKNAFDYSCPKCGRTDRIDVEARVWVHLVPDGTEESDWEGGHEWSEHSNTCCRHCGWHGHVRDLKEG